MFESSMQVTWRISNSKFPAGPISAILKKLSGSILNIYQSDDTLSPLWSQQRKSNPCRMQLFNLRLQAPLQKLIPHPLKKNMEICWSCSIKLYQAKPISEVFKYHWRWWWTLWHWQKHIYMRILYYITHKYSKFFLIQCSSKALLSYTKGDNILKTFSV